MRCPSCQVDYPPETAECPKCGVALAKWHGGKSLTTPRLEGEHRSSPLILYGGLAAAALGAVLYFRRPVPAPSSDAAAVPSAPAVTAVVETGEAIPNPWRFEGVVADLRKASPVAGAKVDFIAGGKAYRAATDEEGRYKREVPALESGGYAVSVTHPRYHPRYQRGTPDIMTEEFRGRVDCAQFGQQETMAGAAGETVQADFMICPRRR
ncbi:MAG: carboxypeptidase regulatory-like domain-containing protein [Elusimicrobia bacterium]|nr:carboxypeptidase regulatory-like domain-containing protein [Elusimicrobiota bacterium]